jgi:lipoprotein-anchoring transpeptidase ErfK/SrfK
MIKKLLTLLLVCASSLVYASEQKYTISVCMTLSLENALICKKRIYDNMDGQVYIIKDKDEKYYTYLDAFDNKNDAKYKMAKASAYVKQQKPYVKVISSEIIELYSKNKTFIDLNEPVKETKVHEVFVINTDKKRIEKKQEFEELELVSSYPFYEGQKLSEDDYVENNAQTEEESKKIEELKLISMDEFDKADDEKQAELQTEIPVVKQLAKQEEREEKKQEEKSEEPQEQQLLLTAPNLKKIKNIVKAENNPVKKEIVEVVINNTEDKPSILSYEELIIEVDPNTNIMTVNAKINNELKEIKEYKVSTAKKDVKRPFGEGKISKISLNPIWYPTQDTLKSFRKRGINLPLVVPSGHRYNYMGAAKINLTHIVDGKNTFRIHGTLSEKTIGSNESAGCIRMKNSDVLQLATLINDFSEIKSLNDVKVILK